VVAKLPEATTRNPPSAGFLLSVIFAGGLAVTCRYCPSRSL